MAVCPTPPLIQHHKDDLSPEITVGDIDYLLIKNPENFLHASFQDESLTLVLVYTITPGQTVTKSALGEFRTRVLDRDDVFHPEFYRNIVFCGGSKEDIDSDALEWLSEWNIQTQTFIDGGPAARTPPGPYIFLDGETWQPWRVYHDFNGCFMTAFKPGNGDPKSLAILDTPLAGIGGRVVVPSRAYFKPNLARPLDGARVCVKDNIDIAGHKTTLCNRAWMDLYPAKTEHASCVQTLIDAGAVIVGKVKLQAMIMREEPLECVEFTAPFNPRADGYQVPSGSSHASAASIASYDWLDFSLGSDTNGSGRKPASYNGCFSIRPSTGILDTDGVVGFFSQFDMPVFFGRNISSFTDFISVWYGQSPMLQQPPKKGIKILYPLDYLPTENAAQTALIDQFVTGLESAFHVTRTAISLADQWKADCPDGADNSSIADYLIDAGIFPFYHDQYHNSADFRNDYQKKFGKPPFVHRALHWQWEEVGKKISKETRDALWRRSEIYGEWLRSQIFDANSVDTLTVMVLPIETGQPTYRDSEITNYLPLLSGYGALNMSPITRSAEVTAPIGDIPYHSIVTQREERLPIAVSLIGPPGTDMLLVDLVEKGMKAGGLATEVKVGSSMY